jgi:hypothetical protein
LKAAEARPHDHEHADEANCERTHARYAHALAQRQHGYKPLIASLGHLERAEEAKPYVDKLLALEPNFTVERFAKVYPIKYESDREHYMNGLRLAGVPER